MKVLPITRSGLSLLSNRASMSVATHIEINKQSHNEPSNNNYNHVVVSYARLRSSVCDNLLSYNYNSLVTRLITDHLVITYEKNMTCVLPSCFKRVCGPISMRTLTWDTLQQIVWGGHQLHQHLALEKVLDQVNSSTPEETGTLIWLKLPLWMIIKWKYGSAINLSVAYHYGNFVLNFTNRSYKKKIRHTLYLDNLIVLNGEYTI